MLFILGSPLIGMPLHPVISEYIQRNQYRTIMDGTQFARAARLFLATPMVCSLAGSKRASYGVAIFFAVSAMVLPTSVEPGRRQHEDASVSANEHRESLGFLNRPPRSELR